MNQNGFCACEMHYENAPAAGIPNALVGMRHNKRKRPQASKEIIGETNCCARRFNHQEGGYFVRESTKKPARVCRVGFFFLVSV